MAKDRIDWEEHKAILSKDQGRWFWFGCTLGSLVGGLLSLTISILFHSLLFAVMILFVPLVYTAIKYNK